MNARSCAARYGAGSSYNRVIRIAAASDPPALARLAAAIAATDVASERATAGKLCCAFSLAV